MRELQVLTPHLPILSEESRETLYRERSNWPLFWLVDPLDGTKEFIKRNGEFTVNIALIQGHEPVLGVVHAPALDTTYSAAKGYGAFKGDGLADPSRITTSDPDGKVRVVVSRSHAGPETENFLERLRERIELEFVSIGSSLKLCLIAEGRAHLYPRLGPTMEWDTAAAHCVVESAGGFVKEKGSGKPLRYNKRELRNPHFLAGNPETLPLLAKVTQ